MPPLVLWLWSLLLLLLLRFIDNASKSLAAVINVWWFCPGAYSIPEPSVRPSSPSLKSSLFTPCLWVKAKWFRARNSICSGLPPRSDAAVGSRPSFPDNSTVSKEHRLGGLGVHVIGCAIGCCVIGGRK